MTGVDPEAAREFAIEVVRVLRAQGHQALWAGGCVRDQLMGQTPKDYDVATDATPARIREIFGKRRTLPIGAAFGVITVLGPKQAGQLDVVTFRRDAGYSDGRHPDSVAYADAEQDAQRRDFTINGLFYDPLAEQVIDYVGGQEDLRRRVVRAIGDPRARIAEDKLRMLRAVRFAARFDFAIEDMTLAAIKAQARELVIVSAERVATELRLILTHSSRARGVQLLAETGLLETVLPESLEVTLDHEKWQRTVAILAALERPTFSMALAALVREIHCADPKKNIAKLIFERWKLSHEDFGWVQKLLEQEELIRTAMRQPWAAIQPILVEPRVQELLGYAEAVATVVDGSAVNIDYCYDAVVLPPEILDPSPLLNGDDLKELGLMPGPQFGELLKAVRDAQLNGEISTREQAVELVRLLTIPASS